VIDCSLARLSHQKILVGVDKPRFECDGCTPPERIQARVVHQAPDVCSANKFTSWIWVTDSTASEVWRIAQGVLGSVS
jgi:hypothetical protein